MERFELIASDYIFLIKDNKILLMRRFNTGYEDGKHGLPAGHVEDNESITKALIREVKEEIGIKLSTKDVSLVHVMHRREKDIRVDFFFTTKLYKGKPANTEPYKCDDIHWFPLDKLPKNTIEYIRQAIRNYLENTVYSERGWR